MEKLIASPNHQVIGLVTQPDRPAGRGHVLYPPPTKLVAQAQNIPIFQPEKLSKEKNIVEDMKALKPDVLITVAFGQILKQDVLTLAPHGVINLHASLLPKYRGAAPINWAIINGEKMTGLTTMFTDIGVDTGDMLLKTEVPIDSHINAEELAHTLSIVGADLMVKTLDKLNQNKLIRIPQNNDEATHAPRLSKDLSKIDWTKNAQSIHNLIRGLTPWPGTNTTYNGNILKIIKTQLFSSSMLDKKPGTVFIDTGKVLVACGENQILELIAVQPANKAQMKATDWAHGVRLNDNGQFV